MSKTRGRGEKMSGGGGGITIGKGQKREIEGIHSGVRVLISLFPKVRTC